MIQRETLESIRSKREILRLIAEIDPKPEVPALVEPIGPAPPGRATHAAFMAALAGPVRELPAGRKPEDWIADGADSAADPGIANDPDSGDPADAEHARPLHYKVQFTASQEFVDLLDEAKDLLGHITPRATLPEIQVRALRALVQQLRTRKRAATKVRHGALGASFRRCSRCRAGAGLGRSVRCRTGATLRRCTDRRAGAPKISPHPGVRAARGVRARRRTMRLPGRTRGKMSRNSRTRGPPPSRVRARRAPDARQSRAQVSAPQCARGGGRFRERARGLRARPNLGAQHDERIVRLGRGALLPRCASRHE
jgi:hypothetical protein